MTKKYSYILAITGASGSIYGISLLKALIEHSYFVHLIVSEPGFTVMKDELDMFKGSYNDEDKAKNSNNGNPSISDFDAKQEILNAIKLNLTQDSDIDADAAFNSYTSMFELLDEKFLESKIASGSAKDVKGMAVVPCSMGSLARIACGISGNLIERAADVILKEKKRLVVCPRETPFNDIHLKNMLSLYSSGAVILPLIPGFYNKPKTVRDIVDFMTGRILDSLSIENDVYERWEGYN
ncbi:MAG: UbiX family flavin prenyltransferase [Candidatus Acidulodesulfobacterium sp.]